MAISRDRIAPLPPSERPLCDCLPDEFRGVGNGGGRVRTVGSLVTIILLGSKSLSARVDLQVNEVY